jgi:hypothetical protein
MSISCEGPIDVQFCVSIGNNTCLRENILREGFARYKDLLYARVDHEGAILFEANGLPEVRIEDELQVAIPGICFRSVPEFIAGRSYGYSYFSMAGVVSFDPQGDAVQISGDYIPTICLARLELAERVYECGLRFIDYLRLLRGDAWNSVIDSLGGEAEVARRALPPPSGEAGQETRKS